MDLNDIIIRPVISEKTTALMEFNKYVFRVAFRANKIMVQQAFKSVFGVEPEKINIMIVRGKNRRIRYQTGKRTAWKKAIVTLKKGDKIDVFEGK